jgi:predicted nucleic acid-binding protein
VREYVLDTPLYVRAFRSQEGAAELEEYFKDFTLNTYLSSVVLHELLVGARTVEKARQIQEALLGPLVRAGRVITPSHSAWEQAGLAISAMARKEGRDLKSVPKSLVNDVLLAASCRESGMILITENVVDFELIRRYLKHDQIPPWPQR